jgi:hypothetical protein
MAVSVLAVVALAGEIQVQKVQGDVSVRHGVTEGWNRVAVGDILRPDDSMKTGAGGSAALLIPLADGSLKRVTLPAEVIVDMSDVRDLSQEELMLKLAMEKVRSSSYEWKNDELRVPNASVVHGTNKTQGPMAAENDVRFGQMQIRGTRVLYDNGYYSTCALKSLEVFRLFPSLGGLFDNRLLVAEALERAELRGEALNEYGSMLKLDGLTTEQVSLVRARMAALKK